MAIVRHAYNDYVELLAEEFILTETEMSAEAKRKRMTALFLLRKKGISIRERRQTLRAEQKRILDFFDSPLYAVIMDTDGDVLVSAAKKRVGEWIDGKITYKDLFARDMNGRKETE